MIAFCVTFLIYSIEVELVKKINKNATHFGATVDQRRPYHLPIPPMPRAGPVSELVL